MTKPLKTQRKLCRIKTSASLLTMAAMGVLSSVAVAQDESQLSEDEVLLVTGQRASLATAQDIKRYSDNIVDSIVAEDIGKLPDRSIAEALQRVPGVSVTRFDDPGDPEHFAGEGAGVSVRGLPQVRAELNGRDIFSASDGRSLSFDDVPATLMAGVDVYKTPTADMVEGGLGGIVNLRTRMPFDDDSQVVAATVKGNYGDVIDEVNYEGSVLYSNNWDTSIGRLGFLIDLSTSETSSRADNLYNRAFFPRDDINEGETVWVPKGSDWRRNDYFRERDGQYVALQWAPTESTELYFTAFQSEAKRDWYENAFFLDAGSFPVPTEDNDWVYDSNNALVSGTMTAPEGIALGTSSRIAANESKTGDFSGGFKWSSDAWTVSGDVQRVLSSATREDYTLGTVVSPQYVRVADLNSSSGPAIEDVDNTLADLSNYSYGQMMTLPADNDADSNAARLDVQYDFDQSIVKSVKAGVRYSKRKATNRDGSSWSARVQPWNAWTWGENVPRINNEDLVEPFSYDDFQRGNAKVPTEAWMFNRDAMNDFVGSTNAMIAATPPAEGFEWATSTPNFETDANLDYYANTNTQEEKTQAAYVRLDFGFGEQVKGNIGVRYVETENLARGHFQSPGLQVGDGTIFYFPPQDFNAENDYTNVLPSLNLMYYPTEDVVLRFSASQAIWRPEFWRMKAVWSLDTSWDDSIPEEERPTNPEDVTLDMFNFDLNSDETNPYLEPMLANQFDLSAEWYFNDAGGMLYGAFFKKDVSDFFRTQNLQLDVYELPVTTNTVVNTGTADITGFEVGATYYFDNLPGPFDGFGVTANYTYVDSSSEVPANEGTEPVDTDGSVITDLPLEGLSENTYNVALMYEKYGFYARLAYNYSSESLQSIGPNGWNGEDNNVVWKLPVFADEYGQLDLSMGYDINEHFSVNFEAYNISQSETKGIMRQNDAGDHTAFVYSQDTRYGLSLRVTY